MSLSSLKLLFHTLIELKFEQVVYRIYYKVFRSWVRSQANKALSEPCVRDFSGLFLFGSYQNPSHLQKGFFLFLNEKGKVEDSSDWNSDEKSKLWLYNLHYFDDLCAKNFTQRVTLHSWLISKWINENPPLSGNGWEPYPLSIRIVNWVKYFLMVGSVDARWLSSLGRQAQALYAQQERHLLGNHLFANGKALIFVGIFFDTPDSVRWLRRGLEIIDSEIGVQFLDDGGNFELSPMYHSMLLWDVLDLICLAQQSSDRQLMARVCRWSKVAAEGVEWLRHMTHPDGKISFFNDAAFGIAPTLTDLITYAEELGVNVGAFRPESSDFCVTLLKQSGYCTVEWPFHSAKAIFDVGHVGPTYQPGHAHADTLSFELSVLGQRVVVNSGTSQYGLGLERNRQRGTAAHSTVTVGNEDSSEVWAGFRVARRARPFDLDVQVSRSGAQVSCSHDGYRRLKGAPIHKRTLQAMSTGLRVFDQILQGEEDVLIARYYLHPDVKINGSALVLPSGDVLQFLVVGGSYKVVSSTWHPEFGVTKENSCIEIVLSGSEMTFELFWT